MRTMRIYPSDTDVSDIISNGEVLGYELKDYSNDDDNFSYVSEELMSSNNTLKFSYPIGGDGYKHIKNKSLLRYPTQDGYNLYVINVIYDDYLVDRINVEADHYTINYMSDRLPFINYDKHKTLTLSKLVQLMGESKEVSDDLQIHIDDERLKGLDVSDAYDSYLNKGSTVGQFFIGPNSYVRRFLGARVLRKIDGLHVIEHSEFNREVQVYPIKESINVEEFDYEIDTTELYTVAYPDLSTIPNIDTKSYGELAELNGIGDSGISHLLDVPNGDKLYFYYKGLPLISQNGKVTLGVTVNQDGEEVHIFKDGKSKVSNFTVSMTRDYHLKITVTSDTYGQTLTVIDETMDLDYVKVYSYVNSSDSKTNTSLSVMGKVSESLNEYEDGSNPSAYNLAAIDKALYQFPVFSGIDTTQGNRGIDVEYTSNTQFGSENLHFYYWLYNGFTKYWTPQRLREMVEPKFNLTLSVDDMRQIYGIEAINEQIFRLGDIYPVSIPSYDIEMETEITRVDYDGMTDKLVEIEFSNVQDFKADTVKRSDATRVRSRNSNYSKNHSYGGSSGGGYTYTPPKSGGSGLTKEELMEEIVTELDENPLDEPIKPDFKEPELITKTDDGPVRIEWDPPILILPYSSGYSTQSTPVYFNGAEKVEGGVIKLKEIATTKAGNYSSDTPTWDLDYDRRKVQANMLEYLPDNPLKDSIVPKRYGDIVGFDLGNDNHKWTIPPGSPEEQHEVLKYGALSDLYYYYGFDEETYTLNRRTERMNDVTIARLIGVNDVYTFRKIIKDYTIEQILQKYLKGKSFSQINEWRDSLEPGDVESAFASVLAGNLLVGSRYSSLIYIYKQYRWPSNASYMTDDALGEHTIKTTSANHVVDIKFTVKLREQISGQQKYEFWLDDITISEHLRNTFNEVAQETERYNTIIFEPYGTLDGEDVLVYSIMLTNGAHQPEEEPVEPLTPVDVLERWFDVDREDKEEFYDIYGSEFKYNARIVAAKVVDTANLKKSDDPTSKEYIAKYERVSNKATYMIQHGYITLQEVRELGIGYGGKTFNELTPGTPGGGAR